MLRPARLFSALLVGVLLGTALVVALPVTSGAVDTARAGVFQYTGGSPTWPLSESQGRGSYSELAAAAYQDHTTGATLPANIDDHRCVVLPATVAPFSASDTLALGDYVAGGGTLIAVTDTVASTASQPTMNALAAALGSGLSLPGTSFGAGFATTTNVVPGPLTVGVSSVGYGSAARVTIGAGAQDLVHTNAAQGNVPFMGAEVIGDGLFVLAGDINALSNFENGAYVSQGNAVLARNLCGSTGRILQYVGGSPTFGFADPEQRGQYTEMGVAVGEHVQVEAVLPGDLDDFDCIVLPANETPFSPAETTALSAYVTGGGNLIALTEQDGFGGSQAAMDVLAGTLGSGLSVVGGLHDVGGFATTTNLDPANPSAADVAEIGFGAVAEYAVAPPGEVLASTPLGTPFIATATLGAGRFVLAGDINWISNHEDGAYADHDNGTLVANLCGAPPVTDSTPPVVVGQPGTAPNGAGWYAASVQVDWVATDPDPSSGTPSDPPDTTASVEGTTTYTSEPSCDPAGNCATGSVTLSLDLTDPAVECGSPPTFALNQPGAVVSASVSDLVSGPAATSVSASVATTSVGSFSALLTGEDVAGRTTTVACRYSVGYVYSGFFSPIDDPPLVNDANAGRTIPVAWRVTDHAGVGIDDPDHFVSLTSGSITCSGADPQDAIETYSGSSGLQYLGDGYWQFNWKTPKAYKGTCRVMSLNLADGVTGRTATFRFF